MKVNYGKSIVVINNKEDNALWLLDNGHGIDTAGKRSPVFDQQQLFEFDFNRKIVGYLTEMLDVEQKNYAIIVPELNDIPLIERVERCNKIAKHYSNFNTYGISVHGNGYDKESANGIEVWTSVGQTFSDYIADIFMQKARHLGFKIRADYTDGDIDKEARFTIITKTIMPFILTENGFYTNYKDFLLMKRPDFQQKIALAHLNTIKEI